MIMKKNARIVCFFLFIIVLLLGAFSNFCYSEAPNSIYLDDKMLPVFIAEDEIPLGEEMLVFCPLVAGKIYHIYLIGDWLDFENPVTDYDVIVYDPYNVKMLEATESAGLPEQIYTDHFRQFFIPEMSGVHKFVIKNDESDSEKAESAIFMIMEHIELNKGYATVIQGRSPGVYTYEGSIYYKCFEFDTEEPFFQVHLDVPDSLEMYEARLYRMASHEKDIGLEIAGIMVPPWAFLEGERTNGFGGFDYKHKSNITRDPELISSCEDFGVDMYINYGDLESEPEDTVFYYLVLLAEFGQGEATLYVKTDTSSPSLELIEPHGDLVAGRESIFKVEVTSDREIVEVWMDYTIDGWKNSETCSLSIEGEYWTCKVPSFDFGDKLQYMVYAKNNLGNIGEEYGEKEVKKEVDLSIELSGDRINAGETITIQGSTSVHNSSLELFYVQGSSTKSYKIKTNSITFQHKFVPNKIGEWSVYAQYKGDQEYGHTRSETKKFDVQPLYLILVAQPEKENVIVGEKILVEGRTEPQLPDIPLTITYSVSNAERQQVTTDASGEFSSNYVPNEEGTCDILVSIKGDWRYGQVQSQIFRVNVQERTIVRVMLNIVDDALTPPTLYITAGAVAVLIILIVLQIWRSRG